MLSTKLQPTDRAAIKLHGCLIGMLLSIMTELRTMEWFPNVLKSVHSKLLSKLTVSMHITLLYTIWEILIHGLKLKLRVNFICKKTRIFEYFEMMSNTK